MAVINSQDGHTNLARAVQEFWEEYTGVRPACVRVLAGDEDIVLWLEGILSPAERQMASTRAGRSMLQELEERILEQARPQLQRLVEGVVGQESTLAEVHLDVGGGTVLGFFRLG